MAYGTVQNFILKEITIIQANETRNHDEQSKEVSNTECGFHIVYDEASSLAKVLDRRSKKFVSYVHVH